MTVHLDTESIFLFTKVLELGSFSAVCQRMRIPKASLSRKITKLERDLGAQLLIRTTRHLQPTEIGKEFLQRANIIINAIEDSKTLATSHTKDPHGLLRITAGVEFGLCILNKVVNAFCKTYPKIKIELDLTGRLVDLVSEQFDLAVRIGPLKDSTYGSRALGSLHYSLYCAPELLAKMGKPKSIKDIQDFPKLAFSSANKNKEWNFFNGNRKESFKLNPILTCNNHWALKRSAAAGLGIVFMPDIFAEEELKSKELVPVLPDWRSESFPIHVLYPQQRFLPPKTRHFIDFLKSHLENS